MTFSEIINDTPILLACLLCILGLVQLFVIFHTNRGTIIPDLRGKDKMWQFIELTQIAWLVLFPVVIISGILLAINGITIPAAIWASMDAVYFMSIGGKVGAQYLDNKTNGKPKTND